MAPAELPQFKAKHAIENSANGYVCLSEDETQIFIRVESLDIGSYPASNKADIMVCIGPRKHYMDFAYNMKKNEINVPHTWTFYSKNPATASFVIAVFKKRYFGVNSEIGQVELRLKSFQPNTVTTKDFTLNSAQGSGNSYPARIRVSVHINSNGSTAFNAPPATE